MPKRKVSASGGRGNQVCDNQTDAALVSCYCDIAAKLENDSWFRGKFIERIFLECKRRIIKKILESKVMLREGTHYNICYGANSIRRFDLLPDGEELLRKRAILTQDEVRILMECFQHDCELAFIFRDQQSEEGLMHLIKDIEFFAAECRQALIDNRAGISQAKMNFLLGLVPEPIRLELFADLM